MSKNVLITGASSGFGRLMALTLVAEGHGVFATMRGINGKNEGVAAELRSAGAHPVELDVTSDTSIEAAAQAVIDQLRLVDGNPNGLFLIDRELAGRQPEEG